MYSINWANNIEKNTMWAIKNKFYTYITFPSLFSLNCPMILMSTDCKKDSRAAFIMSVDCNTRVVLKHTNTATENTMSKICSLLQLK